MINSVSSYLVGKILLIWLTQCINFVRMLDSLDFRILEYSWGKEFELGKVKLIDPKRHVCYCRTKRNEVGRIHISSGCNIPVATPHRVPEAVRLL